jgi:hypothetical protein
VNKFQRQQFKQTSFVTVEIISEVSQNPRSVFPPFFDSFRVKYTWIKSRNNTFLCGILAWYLGKLFLHNWGKKRVFAIGKSPKIGLYYRRKKGHGQCVSFH